MTDAEKLHAVGAGSDEGTKLRQLEGRIRCYGNRKRVYVECTVSEEHGCIGQESLAGSSGLVHQSCHSCGEFVAPEREHLVSWDNAAEELGAENATFSCPAYGIVWHEEARQRQLQQARVVHRDQTIDRTGTVIGELPRTRTCGFRYSAAANSFADVAMIGVEEWRAKRAVDEELAERELMQWTWAWPPAARKKVEEPLEVSTLMQRQSVLSRGTVLIRFTAIWNSIVRQNTYGQSLKRVVAKNERFLK